MGAVYEKDRIKNEDIEEDNGEELEVDYFMQNLEQMDIDNWENI